MAKSRTEIKVTAVYDGDLNATDVFVSLIAQKYGNCAKEYLAITQETRYNKDKLQESQLPSGLCR